MEKAAANKIRCATESDAEDILVIYAPIVRDTAISFELEPPTLAQMRIRIVETAAKLPWLIAESERGIAGYAYASHHRERAAYQWSADVSVYVSEERRGKGIGRGLYIVLLGMLEDLGYYSALAGIALPNPASVGLHELMGFGPIGIYRNIGYKLGAWHDVGWWQRELRKYKENPRPPQSMAEYAGSSAMQRRLAGKIPPQSATKIDPTVQSDHYAI